MVSRGASLLPVKGPLSLLSCFSFSFPLGRFIGPCVYTVGLSDLFREEERRGEENFRDVSVSKKNDRPTAADNSLVRLASKQRIVSRDRVLQKIRVSSSNPVTRRKSPYPKLGYFPSSIGTLQDGTIPFGSNHLSKEKNYFEK